VVPSPNRNPDLSIRGETEARRRFGLSVKPPQRFRFPKQSSPAFASLRRKGGGGKRALFEVAGVPRLEQFLHSLVPNPFEFVTPANELQDFANTVFVRFIYPDFFRGIGPPVSSPKIAAYVARPPL
jgi:hypothetical protein